MLKLPEWYAEALSKAANINLASPKALEEIAPIVEYLTARFMRQEDGIPDKYFSEPQTRRAYLTYFFTTNVLKISPVLRELTLSGFFKDRKSIKALDIGTGVGTAAVGLWLWLSLNEQLKDIHLIGTDVSSHACAEAERTISCFKDYISSPQLRFKTVVAPLETLTSALSEKFELIIAQNVLVESQKFGELLAYTDASLDTHGALVFIEPASRFGSRTLLTFRDKLVDAGYTIYAPCLRQEHCPALEKKTDWCHAISKWQRPKFIQDIDELTGNVRLSLKFSYIVALKEGSNISKLLPIENNDSLYRVVSDRMDEKGRKKFFGCGVKGRILFEKQKRDTGDNNKAFDYTQRYDIVSLAGTEPKANMQRLQKEGEAKAIKKWEE